MNDENPTVKGKVTRLLQWGWLGVLAYCAASILTDPNLVIDQTQPVMGTFYGQF